MAKNVNNSQILLTQKYWTKTPISKSLDCLPAPGRCTFQVVLKGERVGGPIRCHSPYHALGFVKFRVN